ncbi:MAG: hypothetical protein HOC70_05225 [Gammaproteobacteria bacterium]|jgi:uncharacterized protein|nr:hypothetical protein [Gammaproteobacteria bacterium]MBT7370237.1 hypothetical protein [Gammaproteobacteria bacterium]
MLTGPLPALIDHRKLANQGRILEGSVPVNHLSRLRDMLAKVDGDVYLKLAFSKGDQQKTHVSGTTYATVELVCQNCLRGYSQELRCELGLDIVEQESELALLEENADSFIADGQEIRIVDLIEDELILAVPMIPRHADGACPGNDYGQAADDEPVTTEMTHQPFAGLAEAIKNKDNSES